MMIMSFGFDSDNCRFEFKRCLLEYKGREFMMYPGDKRECDSFDTVVQDEADEDTAFELLHEFLYLYGWANRCAFHFVGGAGLSGNRDLLMKRQSPVFRSPRGFWNKCSHLLLMTNSNCSQDFIKAISLYNDAIYNNDVFYRFFCLYKIIDLPVNGKTRNPADWINQHSHLYKNNHKSVQAMILRFPDIGLFLQDECKNAISHIHRSDPAKSSVIAYSSSDYEKISVACDMIRFFADIFIKQEIGEPGDVAVNVVFKE